MYKVQYKWKDTSGPWITIGAYDSEYSAISRAKRATDKYSITRALDPDDNVIWSD